MKKSELRKIIREIIKEQVPSYRPKVIMNPTADQIEISQAEFDKKVAQLKDAKRKLDEGKLPLNEKLNFKCKGCGGAKFGLCAGRGCLEPLKNGLKWTLHF